MAAGGVRIRHGMRELRSTSKRRAAVVGSAHPDGVAGRNGAVCRPAIATPTVSLPLPLLLCPLAEYEDTKQRSEGSSDGAHKKSTEAPNDRLDTMMARLQLSGSRDQLDNLLEEGGAREPVSA